MLIQGDCVVEMAKLPAESIDSVVCDPPYDLTSGKKGGSGAASVNLTSPYGRARIGTGNGPGGFMGQAWDGTGVAFDPATWEAALGVLKPGGYLLAFGGTRTFHRLTCAIEDAGFEIRDCLSWMYASGFPKSLDVSKAIDKAAGAEREITGVTSTTGARRHRSVIDDGNGDTPGRSFQNREPVVNLASAPATSDAATWAGWGTALKPAWEPIIVARKPLGERTVAANVLVHRTGAINVDASRIGVGEGGSRDGEATQDTRYTDAGSTNFAATPGPRGGDARGRWPANVVLGHTPECRQVGTRQVQSGTTKDRGHGFPRAGGYVGGDASANRGHQPPFYGGPDGTETVPAWDCPPECPVRMLDEQSIAGGVHGAGKTRGGGEAGQVGAGGSFGIGNHPGNGARIGDTGGASRFFFTAKSSSEERSRGLAERSTHPTVKPVSLMTWLVRMVTPPGGVVLDPFAGSGSTLIAAAGCGFQWIGIEKDPEYVAIAEQRLGLFGLTP